jgi:hypothetical protein
VIRVDVQRCRIDALHRSLALPLFARAVELEDPEALLVDRAALAARLAPRRAVDADGLLLLSVLVADLSPAQMARLSGVGLSVEWRGASQRLVVGWLRPARLVDLGLLEGVLRVDLVEQG